MKSNEHRTEAVSLRPEGNWVLIFKSNFQKKTISKKRKNVMMNDFVQNKFWPHAFFKSSFEQMFFVLQNPSDCLAPSCNPCSPTWNCWHCFQNWYQNENDGCSNPECALHSVVFFNTLYPFFWTQIEQCCICSTICCVYSPILLPCLFCHLRPSTTWQRMSAPRHRKGLAPAMAKMRSGRGSSLSWLPRHVC